MVTYSFDLFLVRECTDSIIIFVMFDFGCTFDFPENQSYLTIFIPLLRTSEENTKNSGRYKGLNAYYIFL